MDKSTVDILEAIGAIGIQFGRRSQLFSKLDFLAISRFSPRVWSILGKGRFFSIGNCAWQKKHTQT